MVCILLHRLIMKIPEVQDVFNESGINTDDSHDPHTINFIKALGIIYSLKQVGIKSEKYGHSIGRQLLFE